MDCRVEDSDPDSAESARQHFGIIGIALRIEVDGVRREKCPIVSVV
jgi:hypothetical protein